ncbi:S8 family peptidase [Cognatilysobacter bugurensis]|uniref:Extracellular protease n=1 Tax=Cognatilysobacter bugurensis TaxID=543356 RepID=A0A918T4A0_9GAMM|nr:S8 family serine peptidase [Lysobacter bugurensis]GHA89601.1 extracellular protease [Lysobacter bugurensis]
MSNRILRRTRVRALAAATAVVVASMAAGPALAGKADISGLSSQGTDRFIVKYREGSTERASPANAKAAAARAARAGVGGKAVALGHVRRMALGADVLKTDRKLDRAEAQALMQQIAADPSVEYVEVDQIMRPLYTPNDTHYAGYQWHYFEATGGIKADQAWDVTNGSGVVVAVLDTGITSHSDLGSNIIGGYDFISDAAMARDGNGRDSNALDQGDWAAAGECYSGSPASNSSWHGTHVTGTVAALTNNSKGVAGVAFGAKVVPVRVLGKCGGYTSDITDGIIWAAGGSVTGVPANPYPAKVINMSLGGGGTCSSTYQNAINAAVNRGATVVVAAGNSNADTSGFTPASCSNVIAVASTTRTGARSSFSNYGSLIDVAAPGSDIASTVNSGTTTPSTESYSLMSGTSMASPHVAGVAALMIAKAGGSLAPSTVESTLKSTLRPFPTSIDKPIGNGIVNARAAVDAVGGSSGGTSTYTNSSDYSIRDNSTVESPVSVSNRTGYGLNPTSVAVNIVHTYIGDLKVDLIAPDGSVYVLHNRSGGSADNINATYSVNLSSELKNGTWKLRVNDNYSGDTGYINSWSITF